MKGKTKRCWPSGDACLRALLMLFCLGVVDAALCQQRTYIGFVYPAGGQHGTTFPVKLGGQGLDGVESVLISGEGVTARITEYQRTLNNQEATLVREQLREIRRSGTKESAEEALPDGLSVEQFRAKLERRVADSVNRPASASIANVVHVEVTVASDASPGRRELRLVTARGISNPLAFHVGQLPEQSRKPMGTSRQQVLGKEEAALRKRSTEEEEVQIKTPCVVNGQVGSGERNRYRFPARTGQHLVAICYARQLVPFIADAVPGWFQPVLALYGPDGKEVAYDDDFGPQPDPVLMCTIPADGDYTLEIHDAIYRGREDFVYRITIGEVPFVTSVFPAGARTGAGIQPQLQGWNLEDATLETLAANARPGIHSVAATAGKLRSNELPFELGTLAETGEDEDGKAQDVFVPVMVNGRIGTRGDQDVYRIRGNSNQVLVAEVSARRLGSPLDSKLTLKDSGGAILAINDDHEDPFAGANTHHADSYLMTTLPRTGDYFLHIGDTTGAGGEDYVYRLRISEPRPDFELRVVPSSIALRPKSSAAVNVHLVRKDGFSGPVKVSLSGRPEGFACDTVTLSGTQTVARVNLRTTLPRTDSPVALQFGGYATVSGRVITNLAVPAEDRMQAFLWRHLVPAQEFRAMVFRLNDQPQARRTPPRPRPAAEEESPAPATVEKPKFTRQQVAARLRQLRSLYDEGLLTDRFYLEKVAECQPAQ